MGMNSFKRAKMRMKQIEEMKAENVIKAQKEKEEKQKKVFVHENKKEEKQTLGPRKRKQDKE